ncbi:MAG: endonuclease, partial [Paludibacter sp.]
MKLRSSFLSVLLVFGTFLWAAAPSGYYTNANGKNTSALRSALEIIITNGQSVTSYAGLWTAYATTDINLSTGNIWDMYSNCSFTLTTNQCGT